jgi:hypothetical protein
MPPIDVYLEAGSKRTFASAVAWPGWSRSGPDEASALEALLDYGPRYAAVARPARLGFAPPSKVADFRVVERLKGNATTDFGALGVIAACDRAPAGKADYAFFVKVLKAGWRAFDRARKRAEGKALSKGPRGGGRDLDAIVRHVVEAEQGYLGAFGWKAPKAGRGEDAANAVREAVLEALAASARGGIPEKGPRGGVRWPARYFVRRVAWHAIAHAWEIERRLQAGT